MMGDADSFENARGSFRLTTRLKQELEEQKGQVRRLFASLQSVFCGSTDPAALEQHTSDSVEGANDDSEVPLVAFKNLLLGLGLDDQRHVELKESLASLDLDGNGVVKLSELQDFMLLSHEINLPSDHPGLRPVSQHFGSMSPALANNWAAHTSEQQMNATRMKRHLTGEMSQISRVLPFEASLPQPVNILYRALTSKLVIADWENFCNRCVDLYNRVYQLRQGHTCAALPQLKTAPEGFGVSICTVDGQVFGYGDCYRNFTLQECHKPFSYALAVEEIGTGEVAKWLEPARGKHIPIRADGLDANRMDSIMLAALISKRLDLADLSDYVIDFYAECAGAKRLGFDEAVFQSEKEALERSSLVTYFKSVGAAEHPNPKFAREALDILNQLCAVAVTCDQLAAMAAALANGGVNPLSNVRVVTPATAKLTMKHMVHCGLGRDSAEWALRVGQPAYASTAGALLIVIPNVMGLCIFSPKLNESGNCIRGLEFGREFCETFSLGLFDVLVSHGSGLKGDSKPSTVLDSVVSSMATSGISSKPVLTENAFDAKVKAKLAAKLASNDGSKTPRSARPSQPHSGGADDSSKTPRSARLAQPHRGGADEKSPKTPKSAKSVPNDKEHGKFASGRHTDHARPRPSAVDTKSPTARPAAPTDEQPQPANAAPSTQRSGSNRTATRPNLISVPKEPVQSSSSPKSISQSSAPESVASKALPSRQPSTSKSMGAPDPPSLSKPTPAAAPTTSAGSKPTPTEVTRAQSSTDAVPKVIKRRPSVSSTVSNASSSMVKSGSSNLSDASSDPPPPLTTTTVPAPTPALPTASSVDKVIFPVSESPAPSAGAHSRSSLLRLNSLELAMHVPNEVPPRVSSPSGSSVNTLELRAAAAFSDVASVKSDSEGSEKVLAGRLPPLSLTATNLITVDENFGARARKAHTVSTVSSTAVTIDRSINRTLLATLDGKVVQLPAPPPLGPLLAGSVSKSSISFNATAHNAGGGGPEHSVSIRQSTPYSMSKVDDDKQSDTTDSSEQTLTSDGTVPLPNFVPSSGAPTKLVSARSVKPTAQENADTLVHLSETLQSPRSAFSAVTPRQGSGDKQQTPKTPKTPRLSLSLPSASPRERDSSDPPQPAPALSKTPEAPSTNAGRVLPKPGQENPQPVPEQSHSPKSQPPSQPAAKASAEPAKAITPHPHPQMTRAASEGKRAAVQQPTAHATAPQVQQPTAKAPPKIVSPAPPAPALHTANKPPADAPQPKVSPRHAAESKAAAPARPADSSFSKIPVFAQKLRAAFSRVTDKVRKPKTDSRPPPVATTATRSKLSLSFFRLNKPAPSQLAQTNATVVVVAPNGGSAANPSTGPSAATVTSPPVAHRIGSVALVDTAVTPRSMPAALASSAAPPLLSPRTAGPSAPVADSSAVAPTQSSAVTPAAATLSSPRSASGIPRFKASKGPAGVNTPPQVEKKTRQRPPQPVAVSNANSGHTGGGHTGKRHSAMPSVMPGDATPRLSRRRSEIAPSMSGPMGEIVAPPSSTSPLKAVTSSAEHWVPPITRPRSKTHVPLSSPASPETAPAPAAAPLPAPAPAPAPTAVKERRLSAGQLASKRSAMTVAVNKDHANGVPAETIGSPRSFHEGVSVSNKRTPRAASKTARPADREGASAPPPAPIAKPQTNRKPENMGPPIRLQTRASRTAAASAVGADGIPSASPPASALSLSAQSSHESAASADPQNGDRPAGWDTIHKSELDKMEAFWAQLKDPTKAATMSAADRPRTSRIIAAAAAAQLKPTSALLLDQAPSSTMSLGASSTDATPNVHSKETKTATSISDDHRSASGEPAAVPRSAPVDYLPDGAASAFSFSLPQAVDVSKPPEVSFKIPTVAKKTPPADAKSSHKSLPRSSISLASATSLGADSTMSSDSSGSKKHSNVKGLLFKSNGSVSNLSLTDSGSVDTAADVDDAASDLHALGDNPPNVGRWWTPDELKQIEAEIVEARAAQEQEDERAACRKSRQPVSTAKPDNHFIKVPIPTAEPDGGRTPSKLSLEQVATLYAHAATGDDAQ